MRTLLIACLIVARCTLAQLDDVAFVGSLTTEAAPPAGISFYPTNLSGEIPLAGWVADYSITNNLDNATNLPNLVYGGFAGPITNVVASTSPYLTNSLDGHFLLTFDGVGDVLRENVLNITRPFELVFLARWNISGSGANEVRAMTDQASSIVLRRLATTLKHNSLGGTMDPVFRTNEWAVYNVYELSGGSVVIRTNNAQLGSTPGATTVISKLAIGGRYSDGGFGIPMELAELWIYTNNLSSTSRDNLYNYFKTNYPSAGLP